MPGEQKKNILLIFSDQHRYDALGCAGNPDISTPNLDKLAFGGMQFKNTWCQSPFCQPSRTSFVTGLYPHQTGFREIAALNNPPTLMKKLQAAGYETASFGKMHYTELNSLRRKAGKTNFHTADFDDYFRSFGWDYVLQEFDKYHHVAEGVNTPYLEHLDKNGFKQAYQKQIAQHMRGTSNHWKTGTAPFDKSLDLTNFLTDAAIQWLDKRSSEKPFFLKLAYVQPHPPLISDSDWSDYYSDIAVTTPSFERIHSDIPIWKQYIAGLENHAQLKSMKKSDHVQAIKQYYAMISLIDEEIGRLFKSLESRKMLENTTIVYTSDHGEMMGEHRLWGKMNFHPGSVQVPLIVNSGEYQGGEESEIVTEPVELLDLHHVLADSSETAGKELQKRAVEKEFCFSQYGEFAAVKNRNLTLTMHLPSSTVCEVLDTSIDSSGKAIKIGSNIPRAVNELRDALAAHHSRVF